VIAEPMKRLGKFTFADALDAKFDSPGIKGAAGISTLIVSVFYLIPQMSGAGALIQPLLGFPHSVGVVLVGIVVITIVVTAGMVSTTWVQFLKGSLLVIFSAVLVFLLLGRGFEAKPDVFETIGPIDSTLLTAQEIDGRAVVPAEDGWEADEGLVRLESKGGVGFDVYSVEPVDDSERVILRQAQAVRETTDGTLIDGAPKGKEAGQKVLKPVGTIASLPDGENATGAVSATGFFTSIRDSQLVLWRSRSITHSDDTKTTVYFQKLTPGNEVLRPGEHPKFAGIRNDAFLGKLNFLSLMLALFCGTASLPHILIRYYTVKDGAAARKSTIVGIASIGFFYVLTLYIGLGAMTSGAMDPTNNNMAAPLLARSINTWLFAIISAIAFTTVLGTVSGLILASSGAVAHDLMVGVLGIKLSSDKQVRVAKIAAVIVGAIAIVLGIVFKDFNVGYLVGWAFSIAASANLPALVMLLFWNGTTKQGVISSVLVGMFSSLGWILLSSDTYKGVYGWDPETAIVPFSQPGIVTIPLAFLTLIVVSLATNTPESKEPEPA
ncbi:MAG: cation acetate symporter, partial [Planctomycetota bacterium]